MIMYEIYKEIRDKKGLTDYRISKETGISQSTFTDWKNGRSKPKRDKMQKIADALGVTIDFLTTGAEKSENALTGEEHKILALYRKLNAAGKSEALKRISELSELGRYTEQGKKSSFSKIG